MDKARNSFIEGCRVTTASDDDRNNAKWLLGNLVHYFDRRSNYKEDVETIAKALAASRCEGASE